MNEFVDNTGLAYGGGNITGKEAKEMHERRKAEWRLLEDCAKEREEAAEHDCGLSPNLGEGHCEHSSHKETANMEDNV